MPIFSSVSRYITTATGSYPSETTLEAEGPIFEIIFLTLKSLYWAYFWTFGYPFKQWPSRSEVKVRKMSTSC